MKKLYMIFGLFIVLAYGFVDYRGLELTPRRKQFVPHGLRSAAHGGYRSFWFIGYHGGK